MAKISAHSLKPRRREAWVEEVKHFDGDRYSCSCGWSGDLEECPGTLHKADVTYLLTEAAPDVVIPISVRRLSKAAFMAVTETAEEKIAKYVTGFSEEGKADYVAPEVIVPTPGHDAVSVSPNICLIAASIEAAQLCELEERYDFEEIVRLINDDSIYGQMLKLGMKVQPGMDGATQSPLAPPNSEPGSPGTASTEEPSAPLASSTD